MNVILALDVGSSSVRCSAFRIVENEHGATSVKALDGCHAQLKIRSVQPNSGKIILNGVNQDTGESYNLLDEIDGCIDQTLKSLRELNHVSSFQVVGLGFSTLVMNLIGVDKNGKAIGEEATISYACNSPAVAQQCRDLKR